MCIRDSYKSLGFKEVVMLEESCMLENNGCTMEIYQRHDDLSQKPIGIIDHIAFVSNDIDAAYEAVSYTHLGTCGGPSGLPHNRFPWQIP